MLAEQAETAARSITSPDQQAQALSSLAQAAAAAGEWNRAETAIQAIRHPDQQAQALSSLAGAAEPDQARSLLALALISGHWESSVGALVLISPAAVTAIADQYLRAIPSRRTP
jgi:hypothetical protein